MVSAGNSRSSDDGMFMALLSLDFLYSKYSLTSISRGFSDFWNAERNSAGGRDLNFRESGTWDWEVRGNDQEE